MFLISATQAIQNKIHHISIKKCPCPKVLDITANGAAIHFPRTLGLETFALSMAHLYVELIVTNCSCFISCKASLDLFLSLHPLFPFIFISQFNSYILGGCLSGPTHFMYHIYCGNSFPKPQGSLSSVSSPLHPSA